MTYQPTPPPIPPRRRHWLRWSLLAAAAFAVAFITVGALAGGSPQRTAAAPAPAPAGSPTAAPAAAPAPAPSPDGTYTGSCDTSLAAGISGANWLTGEVDLANTGNVGTVVAVTFRWRQEAYPSIVEHKTVRTRPGQQRVVRFHYNAGTFATSTAPLDRDQAWQENHGFRDPCTYRAVEVSMFGSPQG